MPQIVECPRCQKPLWVGDAGTGLTTICSGCGTEVEAPGATKLASGSSARGNEMGTIVWVGLGLGAIAAAIGGAAWYFLMPSGPMVPPSSPIASQTQAPATASTEAASDSWEITHRTRLLAMKLAADRLAAAGELRPALEQYRAFQKEVGDHQPIAADFRRAITDAKAEEQKVVDQLLQGPVNPSATATTQPVAATDVPSSVVPVGPVTPAINPATATTAPVVRTPRTHIARAAQKIERRPGDITDDEIGRAIERGVDAMLKRFNNGQLIDASNDPATRAGENSLAIYSLLQASLAIKDERLNIKGPLLKGMLETLKGMKIEGGTETYAHALRATTLAVYNRQEDRASLRADVNWLLGAAHGGGFGYHANNGGGFDNSNSQYGLLGVWAGAEAGVEVPQSFWQSVEKHWADCQGADGQWGYSIGPDRAGFAMDCAGTASLFVTHDYLDATKVGTRLGRPPFSKPLEKAMGWIEEGDHSVTLDSGSDAWFVGYNLYGLERVGLASGMKHLGKHDWYRELARVIVDVQRPNGALPQLADALHIRVSGGGQFDLCDQAYVLLFLSRGRHPVMFSKLRFDGFWANRPRDAANIARYASRELERPLNWQIVSSQRGWTDWMDSPVLYIAGHEPPKLTDTDYENLRAFAQAGGMIYLNSDGGSEPFTRFVNDLSKKLFPAYEIATLPQNDPMYSVFLPMATRPVIRGVSNGARLLLVHTPGDPAIAWQQRAEKTRIDAFQLGVNLFVYSAGKTDFRNRLTTPVLPDPASVPTHKVPLARLRYGGNWDPEPGAAPRLSRYLWQQTGWALDVKGIDLAALAPDSAPIAHLTGTAAYTPTGNEIKAIKDYVEAGGVLVIDCCGGSTAFNNSLETSLLPRAFPAQKPIVVDAGHPLLNGKSEGSSDLGHTRIRIGQGVPPSPVGVRMFAAGKGHVIYSPLDITCGLLGTSTAGITGFKTEYATALMKNIVLWTEDGQPDN